MSTEQEITFQNMNEVLPEGWLALKLGDVIDYGKTQKIEPANISNETWVLELEDIEKDTSKLLSRIRFLERKSKSAKNKFNQGDVLYGKLRPYLNKVFIADESGVCTTEIVPISKSPFLDSAFVFYWLKSLFFINYVSGVVYGLNMPRLGTKEGLSAPFFLPPLAEQQEIATRLDDLLAQVDAIKARLDAIPAILKRFRQAVLAAAVSGRLFKNNSWEVTTLAKIADSRLGKMLDKQKNQGNPHLYLRNVNVRWFNFDLSDLLEIKVSDDELDQLYVRKGDILICEGGEPGRCAIWRQQDNQYIFQKALHRVRVKNNILPEWVCFFLKDAADTNKLDEYFTGTTIKHLTGQSLKQLSIPLPPLKEQTEIVNRVEQLFAFADQIEQQVQAAQIRVNQLTQAILAKAFKGELTAAWRAAHPELISGENSAEALLEKIKVSQIPAKPKRGKTTNNTLSLLPD